MSQLAKGDGGLKQFWGFPGQLVSYPPGSNAFREFSKAKGAIGGIKYTVESKVSLLDEVAEEETELELALGELGLSRTKRVKSRSKKVTKAQSARSMTGVDEGTRQKSGDEVRAKTPGSGSSAQPNLTTSKITHKFPKREIKKALSASGTTVSSEVTQGKRRRVESLGGSVEKVTEGRSISVDDLKEVEERARLSILKGKEDTSQMVARLVKGIWLGIEEQESELKKVKSELEKNLVRAKTNALKEVKQLMAAYAMAIIQLQEEVDAVKAETCAEEEEEEAEVLGVVDGLDGVSFHTVLDNQGDDVELPKDGSKKVVREMSVRINDLKSGLTREKETSKDLLSTQVELQVELDASRVREDHAFMCNREFAEQFDKMNEANENREDQYVKAHFRLEKLNQVDADLTRQVEEKDYVIKKGSEDLSEAIEFAKNLQRQVDALAIKERMRQKFIGKDDELRVARENLSVCDDLNERVARLITERDQAIARAKKVEAREHSGGSRNVGHVQKGNANLREYQHNLDATLIREKFLEGEIKAKEFLLKGKEELLKHFPVREELNAELGVLHARVAELLAMNLVKSAKYIDKLKEDVIYHDRVDADIIAWKDTCASSKVRHERLKARFVKVVVSDVARPYLLKVIVANFVEKLKGLSQNEISCSKLCQIRDAPVELR
ncbi:hypothetical protein GIB67_035359 [Kingdonia uniflora]|uniref:Uncharacterized protein n=1 Tax=Kingdonia uniflora TaxID=39325 RepID=A0A7J7NTE5_9MAGN|nr:hypothetical protein GIB67_035359 [Kingdonia uniflora]